MYIFAFILFLVLDFVFLYLNGEHMQTQIADVQRVVLVPNYYGIVITYILLFFGLYYFILRTRKSPVEAAMLGVLVNGTYEFTNLSTLKKWKITTAIMDTVWGGTLWGITTMVTYSVYPK